MEMWSRSNSEDFSIALPSTSFLSSLGCCFFVAVSSSFGFFLFPACTILLNPVQPKTYKIFDAILGMVR